MRILELNHVALHVADLKTSSEFYGGVLGLSPLPRPAFTFPGLWFAIAGGQELHLIGRRAQPVNSQSRGNHFAIRVADIKEAEERLRSSCLPFQGPMRRPDGAVQIFVTDPDGHFVELCELPESRDC